MTALSVNVNKVATLRNTRPRLDIPNVAACAEVCLAAGAHGITVHPRPDERHIRAPDLDAIAALMRERFPERELNIEGNPFHGVIDHAERVRPAQVTLVPDAADASTSDHGWDLERDAGRLESPIAELSKLGARVSLFMDVTGDMVRARELGARRIELYTEPYAVAFSTGDRSAVLRAYAEAAQRAREVGLEVNAGHDLNLQNLAEFLATVRDVSEVSIGHALVADALLYGFRETVRRYLTLCETPRPTD